MNKKQQEEQRRQEDAALKQGLLWVAGAAVLEVLLFLLNRFAIEFDATAKGVAVAEVLLKILPVLRIAGAAAFVVGAVLWVLQMKKGGAACWTGAVCVGGLAVMICTHTALVYSVGGMRMLYLLVPVMGGMALCFHIYPRDFFFSGLPVLSAVLGLWFVRAGGMGVELVLTALVCVAALAAVAMLKKQDGAVKVGETAMQLLPEKTCYTLPLVSAAAALAVLVLGGVLGGMAAYFMIFAMGAWLFALLVYFTVKML